MKHFRKLFVALALVLLLGSTGTMTAVASSNSVTTIARAKNVNLSGYKHYKKKKATTYMKGKLNWAGVLKAKFSGSTGGKYSGSKKANKIVHTDSISASGIGSVSVGYHTGNATVSGSRVNYSYSAKNTKSITNKVSYTISKGVTFSATVTAATKYTWGSTNYRIICGDCG